MVIYHNSDLDDGFGPAGHRDRRKSSHLYQNYKGQSWDPGKYCIELGNI